MEPKLVEFCYRCFCSLQGFVFCLLKQGVALRVEFFDLFEGGFCR